MSSKTSPTAFLWCTFTPAVFKQCHSLHDKRLWDGLLFHPLPSGSTLYTLECGFWECFLLCLHYLNTNMVLQREGYTTRFVCFFKGLQKAQAGPGAVMLTVQGSFTLLS